MPCIFHIDLQALLPWAPFAPALAALIIGLPTVFISFAALRQSARNVEKTIQLQKRQAYFQELRSNFSQLLALSCDAHHAHLKMRETKKLLLQFPDGKPVPEPLGKQIIDLDQRLDRVMSDFNRVFHSSLILLDPQDDPDHKIESAITKLFNILGTPDEALKDDTTVRNAELECFTLFREFSSKKS